MGNSDTRRARLSSTSITCSHPRSGRSILKLVTYARNGAPRCGVIEGGSVRDAGDDIFAAEPGEETVPLGEAKLLAPVLRPGKIICIGLNYRDHAEEAGMDIPTSPICFAKYANTIVGAGEPIRIPAITSQVDYEAELGVVIGKRAEAVSEEEALDHVLGYTCVNDVSARDIQLSDGQWTRGKTLDSFCPTGPWIVTTDEVPDPQSLAIRCVVNGETMQDSNTDQMIFGVAELVSFLSQGITLEPGDLIATGTPPGVGMARDPQVFLRPGDTVSIEIDGIGTLTNPVEAR